MSIQYYYPKIFIKSQRKIVCGSNFCGSDVTMNVTAPYDYVADYICKKGLQALYSNLPLLYVVRKKCTTRKALLKCLNWI